MKGVIFMRYTKTKFWSFILAGILILTMLTGCVSMSGTAKKSSAGSASVTESAADTSAAETSTASGNTEALAADMQSTDENPAADSAANDSPAADTSTTDSESTVITVEDNKTVEITEAGTYTFTGSAENFSIRVNVDKEEKVWIVLDGVTVTNEDAPVIYVLSADKVHVVTSGSSILTVTDAFTADGETNLDAVIFAKDDLELEGDGELTIVSAKANGISCKNDLEFTGGTYRIETAEDAIEAEDSITIADGTYTITSGKDAIHCENDEDDAAGSIEISSGTFAIVAADDGVQAQTTLTINGGELKITAAEGLEATSVEINDGMISVSASDDGINATDKSSACTVEIVINGGEIYVSMGAGDTDAIDSNGNLYINGGTINITAQSAFDYDGIGQLNGGTVIVNGSQITQLSNSMMGGGMGGRRP